MSAPEICPLCGSEVPPGAKACPACGACEQTGWSESAVTDSLGLPRDDFDYDTFVKEEFDDGKPAPRSGSWFWATVAVLAVAGLLFLLLRHS